MIRARGEMLYSFERPLFAFKETWFEGRGTDWRWLKVAPMYVAGMPIWRLKRRKAFR